MWKIVKITDILCKSVKWIKEVPPAQKLFFFSVLEAPRSLWPAAMGFLVVPGRINQLCVGSEHAQQYTRAQFNFGEYKVKIHSGHACIFSTEAFGRTVDLLDREPVPDISIQGRTQSHTETRTIIFVATGRWQASSSYFIQSVCVSPSKLSVNGTLTASLDRKLWDGDRRHVWMGHRFKHLTFSCKIYKPCTTLKTGAHISK